MHKKQLDSDDVFIIVAQAEVHIWVGKGCTLQEKKEATANAMNFISSEGMDKNTRIERVSENNEGGHFKSLFSSWDPPMSYKRMANIATNIEEKDVDVASLLSRTTKMDTMVDDGSGKTEVFIVKDFKLEEVDVANHGEFFGGDSYVIIYTYLVAGRERGMIYFWLGDDSTADERGSAALLAKEMDDTRFRGGATQVRVTQGKSPSHFRAIFGGLMIVHAGGNASGFKNSTEEDTKDEDGIALFHVKGTTAMNTAGMQVAEKAESLNGEDCFVLVTPTTTHVWSGNAADDIEKQTAMRIAQRLNDTYLGVEGRTVSEVKEGEETEDFWAPLGGKGEYLEFAPGDKPPRPARLFEASTATGAFTVEEVEQFVQDDLCDEDVYLLDTYCQLFIWIGTGATEEEKRKAQDVAKKFITDATDDRDPDMPIIEVAAGSEPPMFSQHFLGWDNDYAEKHSFKDPYAAKLAAMEAKKAAEREEIAAADETVEAPVEAEEIVVADEDIAPGSYTVEQLRGRVPGVEPHKKEMYLSDADFTTVFAMSRSDFKALPAWKAKAAKQKVGLF